MTAGTSDIPPATLATETSRNRPNNSKTPQKKPTKTPKGTMTEEGKGAQLCPGYTSPKREGFNSGTLPSVSVPACRGSSSLTFLRSSAWVLMSSLCFSFSLV